MGKEDFKLQFIVAPLSRHDLRNRAMLIRQEFGLVNQINFPIMEFVEIVLPEIMPDFVFRVAAVEELGDLHGLTYPEKKLMKIREDVYERAIAGEGRDRLTVAHELGHLVLHKANSVAYARTNSNLPIVTYCNPEWQANAFAGELLVPSHLVKGMNALQFRNYVEFREVQL